MTVDIEQRLTGALDRLATAYVPDATESSVDRQGPHRRVLAVAAVLVVALGVGGLALVATNDSTAPAATAPLATDATITTNPTGTGPTDFEDAPFVDESGSLMLATLPEDIGGPGEVIPALQRWLYEPGDTTGTFAVRRSSTGTVVDVVSWLAVPQSEWDKTFWDQPEVTLPSGAVVKRLVTTVTSRVVYALQLESGRVLTASSGAGYEQEMATWFDTVLRPANPDHVSGVEAPQGYELFVSPLRSESVSYPPIGVSITTAYFPTDMAWDLESWARTDPTVVEVTSIDGRDAVVADHVEGIGPSVFARLEDGFGVQLLGPDRDQLVSLLDSLNVRPVAPGDIPERSDPFASRTNGTSEPAIRGEVSLGRFFIVESTDAQQTCRSFDSTFNGGTSRCEPTGGSEPTAPICNATGRLLAATGEWEQLATVVVATELADSVGISIDGTIRTTTVEPVASPDGNTGLSMVWATATTSENADVSFLDGDNLLAPPLDCG